MKLEGMKLEGVNAKEMTVKVSLYNLFMQRQSITLEDSHSTQQFALLIDNKWIPM